MVKLTLESNNFQFNGDNYLQVGGTAMGTRVAPSLANIFMADFEEKYVYTYHKQPLFWKRYLDDCVLVWVHGEEELKKFLDHLNSVHPTIKFTMEYSPEKNQFSGHDTP